MAKRKVDIKNFMGVIQSTEQTENGIRFPGEYMLSGNPVVAEGVTLDQLMSDRVMAETWHQSIVSTYEREKEERNQPRSNADTPDLVIGGQDAASEGPGGGQAAAPQHRADHQEAPEESLEDGLRRRLSWWQERLERAELDKAVAVADIAEASRQVVKIEAALDAVRDA